MSLWKVDDAATRQWMGALYEARLVSRAGTAEAVQEASRRILRERREKGQSVHPATWGGFIATGRWD
jgi:CHAT domain-containing protein